MPVLSELDRLRSRLVELRRAAAHRGSGADADVIRWATEIESIQQLIDMIDRAIDDERQLRGGRRRVPTRPVSPVPARVRRRKL